MILSVHFNGHFPGGPGLAGTRMSPFVLDIIGAKDNGGGGNNWKYKTCKAAVETSPPTNQQPCFYCINIEHQCIRVGWVAEGYLACKKSSTKAATLRFCVGGLSGTQSDLEYSPDFSSFMKLIQNSSYSHISRAAISYINVLALLLVLFSCTCCSLKFEQIN